MTGASHPGLGVLAILAVHSTARTGFSGDWLVYPKFDRICALPHDRKQESPQRHRGTEQKEQVGGLIFFSVSLRLCGDSLFLSVIKDTDFYGLVVYVVGADSVGLSTKFQM